jgi:imidazolonepropionase-like amidohydrolase
MPKTSYSSLPSDQQQHIDRIAARLEALQPFESAELYMDANGLPQVRIEYRHKVSQTRNDLRDMLTRYLFTDFRFEASRFQQPELVMNFGEHGTERTESINERAKR